MAEGALARNAGERDFADDWFMDRATVTAPAAIAPDSTHSLPMNRIRNAHAGVVFREIPAVAGDEDSRIAFMSAMIIPTPRAELAQRDDLFLRKINDRSRDDFIIYL